MKSRAIQVLQSLPTGVWVLTRKTVLGCMEDRHSVVIQVMRLSMMNAEFKILPCPCLLRDKYRYPCSEPAELGAIYYFWAAATGLQ